MPCRQRADPDRGTSRRGRMEWADLTWSAAYKRTAILFSGLAPSQQAALTAHVRDSQRGGCTQTPAQGGTRTNDQYDDGESIG